ncbi:MAG: PTS glucose transporter subunit IIA [Eubacteriales bacterium]|nr:PTS glucose transporter subunit IIA [Eubacteriales bacterium]
MGLFGKLFGKDGGKTVCSPLKGTVIPLSQVEDPAFSQGIMGPGVGIEPAEGKLFAPADGEIAAVFPTGHAVGMRTKSGIELLIHIGIDTVQMNGDGFSARVKQGDHVKAGDLLVEFDCQKIIGAGFKTTTMVLASNAAELGEMSEPAAGRVDVMDPLYSFR